MGTIKTWLAAPYRVGSWSALDQVAGIRVSKVAASEHVSQLVTMESPPAIKYRYRNLQYSLDEYLERRRATGLLILKDGMIVAERYRYMRGPDARFLSFSMAKSVTSLLVGIAQSKGYIQSLDDPAEKYAKSLAGTAYGQTSIRHLLRMSSGVRFSERYDGNDDVTKMAIAFGSAPDGSLSVLRAMSERQHQAGEKFSYASAETEVVGYVLTGATGQTIAQLTKAWLWDPIGAERDAFWRVSADGQEGASAYFSASLRDWGRLGAMLAADGRVKDKEVVPREYLLDATDPARQPRSHAPYRATNYLGYGYFFWLLPYKQRTFMMQGVFGQLLYVQPSSGIVMVVTSVWKDASGMQDPEPWRESNALWAGVLKALDGNSD